MILGQVFDPKSVNISLESTDKDEVFEELVESLVAVQPGLNRAEALAAVQEREAKLSTGIGRGVAVPHGICSGVSGVKGAIGISRGGIEYDSLDKAPVRIIFMLLSGRDECEYHLQVIKRLAQILEDPSFVDIILSKTTPQDVYDTLVRFEDAVTAAV
ncbi:PTS sugar transporter subunit IIA [Treponema brennaborense]|uniref:PTS IIA-like nitrogen-regulatory protein PtsN n=1 Tax=Treponema brennaborense (strain DSM 12168 / CIP 105900 / DD5/3) TaxID=906968 RepID=F4LQ49_TREBD|nr:PTS sugar transporter subunit IIA [Treponema brennaborense]AEE17127.1 putative PTS IIA-like nitrogen-regulatory protein PtsN [Treponema brennaborense DSM 12168]